MIVSRMDDSGDGAGEDVDCWGGGELSSITVSTGDHGSDCGEGGIELSSEEDSES